MYPGRRAPPDATHAQPVAAAMAIRECLSSHARNQASVSSEAVFDKPSGSKTLPPVSGPVPSMSATAIGSDKDARRGAIAGAAVKPHVGAKSDNIGEGYYA